MIPDPLRRKVVFPVRIVAGVPQPFYGPTWPKLKDGVVADLVLPAHAFVHAEDEVLLSAPLGTELLPKGTQLLAGVAADADRDGIVRPSADMFAESLHGAFVAIVLEEPLRIQLRGTKRARLESCRCRVPSLNQTYDSVNEAYTRISEHYEPRRRSHTGNVFAKVLYHRDTVKDRRIWSPLDDLRRRLEMTLEQRFQQARTTATTA